MIVLITVGDPPQDLHGFLRVGFFDRYRLETSFQRRVFFHIFSVFIAGSRADHLQFAPGQGRFEDVGGVYGALRAARADQGMHLIHKENDIPVRDDFGNNGLDPLLKFSPVFGPGHDPGQIQGQQPFAPDRFRDAPFHDPPGQAFHNGGFADTGLAHQAGIVLGPPAEDLNHTIDLALPADDRVQLIAGRQVRQIPAVLGQHGFAGLVRAARLQVLLVVRGILADGGQDLVIDLGGIDAQGLNKLDRHILLFQDNGHEDVLRTDRLGPEAVRLASCHAQDLLAAGRKTVLVLQRQIAGLDLELLHHLPQSVGGDPVLPEDPGSGALLFQHQSLQQMLGPCIILFAGSGDPVGQPYGLRRAPGIVIFHSNLHNHHRFCRPWHEYPAWSDSCRSLPPAGSAAPCQCSSGHGSCPHPLK